MTALAEVPRKPCSIPATFTGEGTTGGPRYRKGDGLEDPLVEIFAWLFVKTDEEILAEAEVAALHSMFLAVDTRPERADNIG